MSSHINLQLGWPTPRLFPAEQLAAATTSSLLDPEIAKSALIYGPDLGYTPFRESVAEWLTSFYQPPSGAIPIDRIAITGGASQNLASILQVFSDPNTTRRIWMVEPTYFLACTIFQDAGFAGRLRGVPENEHGIDIEFLRKKLSKFEYEASQNGVYHEIKPTTQYGKIFRHILYLTPTFSNPSAKTMSTPVRQQLLSLTREYDMLIISDDVYDFLRWPAEETKSTSVKMAPITPRLVDLDRATSSDDSWGNSISNGSFSKIVAPGVRVGWAEASTKIILRLSQNGATRSGGAPSHLTSTFLDHLLSSGAMQKHIDEILIRTYQSRYRVLMKAIKTHLEPLGVRITTGAPYTVPEDNNTIVPAGGFFTYITFPPELPSADVIAKRAKDEQALTFAYGAMFVVKGDETSAERSKQGFGNGARLCWAWHEEEEIEKGLKVMVEAFTDNSILLSALY
ncbi:related to aromatic amino acid aminotransferase and related proteins [Phialocephala subalpina]|uniref:Related to aromatic amino acid aminotransferase and related proteins n=1 Tax=Phialocephala subalpina TaxID=576137 RepID=A0A1L7XB08_9HELO|nr:related to aromatic amino acid aminotransferase and related proteins [Phialocephala subalpina]